MATQVPAPILDLADEDTLAAQAVSYLPGELADRSDSNPAVVIIEAAAWLVGKLLFQLNNWPSAVVQKVLALVGVTLNSAALASTVQTFTLSNPLPRDTTVATGTKVATTDGAVLFQTVEDVTIPAYTAPAGTVAFTAGSPTATGIGTAFPVGTSWVGYQIGIRGAAGTPPVTWYTIASVESTTSLTLTANASATVATSAFYVGALAGTASAQCTVAGSAGNVGAGKLTALQSSPAGVASTTNAAATSGGLDIETVAEAIARAPDALSARSLAVTANDYGYFATQTLGSGGRAYGKAGYNVDVATGGYTSVGLLSPSWTSATPVTASERGSVIRDLATRTLSGSTTVDVAASINALVPAAAIYRQAAVDSVTTQENVAGALNTYLDPATYPWGRTVYVTDLVKAVENATGVDRVHNINGVPAIGASYYATPATLHFVSGSATANTANTAGFVAGRSFVVDATNNTVYLVTAFVVNTSVTLDRVFAGTTVTASVGTFIATDNTMGSKWYDLPYSALTTYESIIVMGSV